MTKTKYIIFDEIPTQFGATFYVPIIFPETLTHEDVANRFGGKENVVSAGFVQIFQNEDEETEYHAYGNSVSLGVKAEEGDSKRLRRVFEQY